MIARWVLMILMVVHSLVWAQAPSNTGPRPTTRPTSPPSRGETTPAPQPGARRRMQVDTLGNTAPVGSSQRPKEEDEDDDEPEICSNPDGDPFARYDTCRLNDQNCDPTILTEFYKKYAYFSCLLSPGGYCLTPTKDELSWAVYGAAGGAVAGAKVALQARQTARTEVLRYLDSVARAQAQQTAQALAGGADNLARMAKPMFVLESERLAARSAGGLIVRGGARGALIGALGGGAVGVALLGLDVFLTEGVSQTACSGREESDPNFRKYVPVERGTCRTPRYIMGAQQVTAFLQLPLKEKLKVLDSNPLICGYYASMNSELDTRIAQLEGGSRIERVTCNPSNGEIEFSIHGNTRRSFTIRRKPRSSELRSFEYRDRITQNIFSEAARFEMTQTEFGSELTRIHRTSVTGMPHAIPYESFSGFVREQPDKGRQLVHAFRTVRKHTPQLIKCCDMDAEEFNKRENRDECPREWFASRATTTSPATPRSRATPASR